MARSGVTAKEAKVAKNAKRNFSFGVFGGSSPFGGKSGAQ
jgi:hypothetical protein